MMALPHVAKRANGHATCIVKFVARMITSLLINALHWESRGQQGIAGEEIATATEVAEGQLAA